MPVDLFSIYQRLASLADETIEPLLLPEENAWPAYTAESDEIEWPVPVTLTRALTSEEVGYFIYRLLLQVTATEVWIQTLDVQRRDEGRCFICGKRGKLP